MTRIRDRAAGVDPDNRTVTLAGGNTVAYDQLVMAPGLQLDFDAVPGLTESVGRNGVSRWPDLFALGDVANLPTSKTGAAIRIQAPVVVANMLAARRRKPLPARYDGYTSCPPDHRPQRMLLAEFDYRLKPKPSFPLIDTMKPRYGMWLLKRHGLPAMYWHGMLRGLA